MATMAPLALGAQITGSPLASPYTVHKAPLRQLVSERGAWRLSDERVASTLASAVRGAL